MGDPRHDLGIVAERAVGAWLERSGWRLLGRRVRAPGGAEVDIVAIDPDGVLVGIEVRARSTARAGIGTESIDARRTARTGRTLAAFAAAPEPIIAACASTSSASCPSPARTPGGGCAGSRTSARDAGQPPNRRCSDLIEAMYGRLTA